MIWTEKNNSLQTTIKFNDFITAWAFMTEVAMTAEKMNHHPTWTNTYNTVDFILCTHDAENTITEKDKILAEKIMDIYIKYK